MRKQDTEGLNLAENAIVVVPVQATSSLYKAGFPKQTALTIRESYALLEKGYNVVLIVPYILIK